MRTSILVVVLCAALGATAASAAVTVSATVAAGTTLSVNGTGSPTFSLTLNGVDQTTSYTLPLSVVDARGLSTGGGWNLTITSTQFTTGSQTLPATASTITSVANSCVTTCTNPTNSVGLPVTVPAGATPPAAVKYFNAAATTGRGRFTNTPTVSVSLPASTLAGTYASTLTLSAVSGP
jgi:WxL domain surface cell wall-binding